LWYNGKRWKSKKIAEASKKGKIEKVKDSKRYSRTWVRKGKNEEGRRLPTAHHHHRNVPQ